MKLLKWSLVRFLNIANVPTHSTAAHIATTLIKIQNMTPLILLVISNCMVYGPNLVLLDDFIRYGLCNLNIDLK